MEQSVRLTLQKRKDVVPSTEDRSLVMQFPARRNLMVQLPAHRNLMMQFPGHRKGVQGSSSHFTYAL
jgi:hypothetical protein